MLCTTLLTAFTSPIAVSARERLRGAVVRGVHGKLITHLAARHRHQEWLAFLKLIDQQSPPDLDIHIIADNYATHKHPRVNKWLQRASSLPHALHADIIVLDEPGRALLRRTDAVY